MRLYGSSASLSLARLSAILAQTVEGPPMAKQVEHISVWHGEKVNDPSFWLREKHNPEVVSILKPKTPTPRR